MQWSRQERYHHQHHISIIKNLTNSNTAQILRRNLRMKRVNVPRNHKSRTHKNENGNHQYRHTTPKTQKVGYSIMKLSIFYFLCNANFSNSSIRSVFRRFQTLCQRISLSLPFTLAYLTFNGRLCDSGKS